MVSKLQLCPYYYMAAPHGCWLSILRKSLAAITHECYELYWTIPGNNILQNNSCSATNLPSQKTIEIRWTRHTRHSWRSKDKLISDGILWTLSHGWDSVRRPARTFRQQLCTDTGCSIEGLPEAIDNRDKWWERVREIHASNMTRWWSSF